MRALAQVSATSSTRRRATAAERRLHGGSTVTTFLVATPAARAAAPAVSPGCACEHGGACDIAHDPAACACARCQG